MSMFLLIHISQNYGLMLMLVLYETKDQLAMTSIVQLYDHILHSEVEGQRKKERPERTWKKQVEEESMKVGLSRDDEQ